MFTGVTVGLQKSVSLKVHLYGQAHTKLLSAYAKLILQVGMQKALTASLVSLNVYLKGHAQSLVIFYIPDPQVYLQKFVSLKVYK